MRSHPRAPGIEGSSRLCALSFRQQCIVVQMMAILAVYGFYAVRLWAKPLASVNAVAVLIGITVLMIAIDVITHVLLAQYSKPEQSDD
jgi:hypothetical protein